MKRVAVFGAGVGGLSAAHELQERGFEVTVYEAREVFGGKARSIDADSVADAGGGPLPRGGLAGRRALPGEHGFRFFPGFYRHLDHTLARIPFAGQSDGVLGNLVPVPDYLIGLGSRHATVSVEVPRTRGELIAALRRALGLKVLAVPLPELAFFAGRLLSVLTSCPERRLAELEAVSWWDFIGAEERSDAYRWVLAIGLTRNLVAARAEQVSARTVGTILIQLLLHTCVPGPAADRVLNGPTSEVWIEPWVAHLERLGVVFAQGVRLERFELEQGRIRGAFLREAGGTLHHEQADVYVAALPVERLLAVLTPEQRAAAPGLARLHELSTAWMNGLQLYLRRDVPIVRGHLNLLDTPSALTVVSQNQFWRRPLSEYGDGSVQGCLSIDISDWNTPGILYGKPLRALDRAELVKNEVVAQLRRALGADAGGLDDDNIAAWFLDPAIRFVPGVGARNEEPLLINKAGSWACRPEAGPHFENLFLAADFVRTHSDLACMESANEAARRATNAILAATGVSAPACFVAALHEPALFAPLRELDRRALARGLAHPGFPARLPVPRPRDTFRPLPSTTPAAEPWRPTARHPGEDAQPEAAAE